MNIGDKILKNADGSFDADLYFEAAQWCNSTGTATIVDKDSYYEIVAIPAPTIEELKQDKLMELDSSFEARTSGAFTTNSGYLMQFDTADSLKMQGAITLMESIGVSTGYITQANDVTKYNIPIETMKQVLVEMLNAYAQCHARKQELRAFINNAQTQKELDEITISWPV